MRGGEPQDGLVVDLVRRAALAGANRALAREVETLRARAFFEKRAAEHSQGVTALANALVVRAQAQTGSW